MSRRRLLSFTLAGWAGLVLLAAPASAPVRAQSRATARQAYRSPYAVAFTQRTADLVGDLEQTERGDFRHEAEVAYEQWYGRRTRERWNSWGPTARTYPPPSGAEAWTVQQKRERAIAVALRYVGYGYQHHHIPDWEPPPDWPWKATCAGSNGKGLDCSNFTGFVYNLGFGLRLTTDVDRQADAESAKGPGAGRTPLHRVVLPASFQERIHVLRTGDMLYIRNHEGRISHVVLWLGPVGRSPDGAPLVIDSHGEGVRDSNGSTIPCGIQLRPFREKSWYNQSAAYALRVFTDAAD